MLLTITYTGEDPIDLGYLLHKNPARPQEFELNYGKAYVFYPEITDSRTTATLLLSIDPIDLARGKVGSSVGGLFDYVNDRPYVSSSFMSTAISRVFGTAMGGRCEKKQELADSALNLEATITMFPCRGETSMLNEVFEPLGYGVEYETFPADEKFPEWGESSYVNLTIKGVVRLCDLLKHVFVLLPVFDGQKHYWVDKAEVEKLLNQGEGWLAEHPRKEFIIGRYLKRKRSLVNLVMSRLSDETEEESDDIEPTSQKVSLNERRYLTVIEKLKEVGAHTIIDIGCGDGNLLSRLVREQAFTKVTGVDVSFYTLERAKEKLNIDYMPGTVKNKLELFQGSLTYRDKRFAGYDAACVIEVIEHLDINRLTAFERVLFEFARPRIVVLTTPNGEYNVNYQNLNTDELRHGDHRFEWSRQEFQDWANRISEKYGYAVSFENIGDIDENSNSPTQMGVFNLCE